MSSSTIRILDVPGTAEVRHLLPTHSAHENILSRVAAALRNLAGTLKTQRNAKALRLCETISLGEKRFLAIVQVDQERILIGGSASTVAMLTRLPEKQSFATVLLERSQPTHPA